MRHEYNPEFGVVFEDPYDPAEGNDDIFNPKPSGGSGRTPTPTPTPRQWQPFSMSQLRQYYRAGALTYEAWVAELIARGGTQESAVGDIATEVTKGLSTAKDAAPGTLSPAEQRAVDALKALIPASTATPTPTATPPPGAPPPAPAQPMGASGEFSYNDELAAYAAQHGGQLPATATGGGGAPPPAAARPATGGAGGGAGGGGAAAAQQAAAPPAPPKIWQYFTDAEGNPYILITETGKTHKLPKGTKENSVTAIYEAMRHLPENSPNFQAMFQAFEQTKQSQGQDEFGRPYYDAGTQASTRYSGAPLPEDLPQYMQQELIGNLVDENKYAKRGLNLDLFPEAEFVRSKSGDNLWIDYDDMDSTNGLSGPVLGPRGNVFATAAEADKAAYLYSREAASDQALAERNGLIETTEEPATRPRRTFPMEPEQPAEQPMPILPEGEEEMVTEQRRRRPLNFAYGGQMQLQRPASVVDQRTGQVLAQAAMNGPEQMNFGGERPGFDSQMRPHMPQYAPSLNGQNPPASGTGNAYAPPYRPGWMGQPGMQPLRFDTRLGGDPNSGMTGTVNQRLVSENPRRYFMQPPRQPGMPPYYDQLMEQQGASQTGGRYQPPYQPVNRSQPINFMDQPPMATPPVVRSGTRQPRPVYNPEKMLQMMRT